MNMRHVVGTVEWESSIGPQSADVCATGGDLLIICHHQTGEQYCYSPNETIVGDDQMMRAVEKWREAQ